MSRHGQPRVRSLLLPTCQTDLTLLHVVNIHLLPDSKARQLPRHRLRAPPLIAVQPKLELRRVKKTIAGRRGREPDSQCIRYGSCFDLDLVISKAGGHDDLGRLTVWTKTATVVSSALISRERWFR